MTTMTTTPVRTETTMGTAAKRTAESHTVEYRDLKVRLYKQAESAVWRIDATKFGGTRKPIGIGALEDAKQYAVEFLKAISKQRDENPIAVAQRRVRDGVALTLGDAFDVFRQRHLPSKRGTYRSSLGVTMAYAEALLGRGQPVAGFKLDKVREYADKRIACDFSYVRPADGELVKPARPPRHRTVFAELVELRTILYAVGNEAGPDGITPLLGFNPLRVINYPYPLEPVAQWAMDGDRTTALLAGLGQLTNRYPPGSLERLVKAIRGTGRRAESVAGLRRRDVLLDPALVSERAIQLCTVQGAGKEWPFGALWWDREFEKKRIDGISPMSERVFGVIADQLERMEDKRPEAFLWPQQRNLDKPLPTSQICNLLGDAEKAARAMGYDVEPVRWLKNHGWRREYRSVRTNLIDDKLVANVVGWELKGDDTSAMNAAYKQYPARSWYLCAEFLESRDTVPGYTAMGINVQVNVPAVARVIGEIPDSHSDPHSPSQALAQVA